MTVAEKGHMTDLIGLLHKAGSRYHLANACGLVNMSAMILWARKLPGPEERVGEEVPVQVQVLP